MSDATDISPWIIGIGNAMRGDDGAGAAVVSRLREDGIPAFAFDGDGAELMEMWAEQPYVIIIDAAQADAAPGTPFRFDAHLDELPKNFFRHSTHQFGVAEAVEMARVLDRLPQVLTVYAIAGQNFQLGAPLSPELDAAVDAVVTSIKTDLQNAGY